MGAPSSSSSQSLVVKSKSKSVPAGLEKAGHELSKKGGRQKFVQQIYLLGEKDINQRVVKGVGTALLSISASASASQLRSAVSIIQWVEKFKIKDKYAEEFKCFEQHINDILDSVSWGPKLSKSVF